ncbi:secretoglobin family 2B member 24-like [Arvicanthis niloticus]|uniref:secretoglobin family 2B member 24-like n=1 Tax=Arvicanthis niloticus TaxID=61156 RepID=UPI001486B219|nr:secretoglobin family 2B member 24-like [Arvicanthis niloticus]
MKGTLLLLALLVIGELGFQTTEACVPFFAGFAGVISGSRSWLHHELSAFNGTKGETAAYEKIQDCYKEGHLKNILLEPKILEAILFSQECLSYYTDDTIAKIKEKLAKLS